MTPKKPKLRCTIQIEYTSLSEAMDQLANVRRCVLEGSTCNKHYGIRSEITYKIEPYTVDAEQFYNNEEMLGEIKIINGVKYMTFKSKCNG